MSEAEDEEEEACYYGTPLDPYDEDTFPKKKPITIEEQVARDAQGRRRFHGAFTGGFSAGFFNTVGSLEGFTPTEFRSSRTEKALNNIQVPEDYMDDEDLGEFGIAPQTVRATDEYNDSKKRKKQQVHSEGPIPGTPVLETLIEAGNETVGYFLIKNMNRKRHQETHSSAKVYGCVMPTNLEDEPTEEFNLHDCYKYFLKAAKCNTFGLGYTSLDKTHLNLFQPAKLTVRERNNKKLSISGQAFGVGAFENEDEDIYVKDDMSRYDFELTTETKEKDKPTKKEQLLFDMFVISNKATLFNNKTTFPPPVIPITFTGKHKVKRSRFEPLPPEEPSETKLNPSIRAKYLGENPTEVYTSSKLPPVPAAVKEKQEQPQIKMKTEVLEDILADRFVSAKQSDDHTNILEPVKKFEPDHGTQEMRAAVKMKMFGPLTRVTLPWQPCAVLCKRFNVPEPRSEDLNTDKRKRTKNLIFEYQKHEEKEVQREPGLNVKPSTSFSPIQTIVTNEPNTLEELQANTNTVDTTVLSETNDNKTHVVDTTDRLDISQKTDLFKAVFLSSSESEASDKEDEIKEEAEKNKNTINILSEPLLPKIKPIKEGILSNLNFPKLEPIKPLTTDIDPNTYGPCLPTNFTKVAPVPSNDPVINIDEWVERDKPAFTEKRHKKKHKKEKKKHKHEHKHKSKR